MMRPIKTSPKVDLACNTPAPIRVYILALMQHAVSGRYGYFYLKLIKWVGLAAQTTVQVYPRPIPYLFH